VPKRVALRHVSAFVAEHHQWLEHHLAKMTAVYAHQPLLPQTIVFKAIDESWQVSYVDAACARVIELSERKELRVHGASEQQMVQALQRWLQQRAKQVLPPWLERISAESGLGYERATVRGQKTRWGSCSARKSINLNRALLFVSPEAVRYLLLHELCHTVYLNHSPRYWALVARIMPEYEQYETELRLAMAELPAWALPGFGG